MLITGSDHPRQWVSLPYCCSDLASGAVENAHHRTACRLPRLERKHDPNPWRGRGRLANPRDRFGGIILIWRAAPRSDGTYRSTRPNPASWWSLADTSPFRSHAACPTLDEADGHASTGLGRLGRVSSCASAHICRRLLCLDARSGRLADHLARAKCR